MSAASLETTLELWASSLREVKERMRPLFTQDRVAASANAFLDGLLGPERRKTGWMRAEAAGDEGPWRQQAILGRGRWQADALRDIVRDYTLETLAGSVAKSVFSAHKKYITGCFQKILLLRITLEIELCDRTRQRGARIRG